MPIGKPSTNKAYYRPMADGKIVHKITKDEYERRSVNPQDNVRRRVWKDREENEQTVYEEVYQSISGTIVHVEFHEHPEYGKNINVTLRGEDGEEGIFTVGTSSRYGSSFLEVMPNIDLEKPVKFTAWSKEKGDKVSKVLFVEQDGENIESYYKKWDEKKKEWKLSHGYPTVDEAKKKKFGDKKYWSTQFFPEVEVFLCEYVEKNIMPKANLADEPEGTEDEPEPDPDKAF